MDAKTTLTEYCYELAYKMNAQDNRSTAYPLYVVECKMRRWVPAEIDWDERERKEEFDLSDLCESCSKILEEGGNIPEGCDDCSSETFVHFVVSREPNLNAGIFLTEEACDAHIAAKSHRYNEPRSYAISAYHSHETAKLLHLISQMGLAPDTNAYPRT